MVGKLTLIAVAICCLATTGRGQGASWKLLKDGGLSLKYPPTWHLTKETRGPQTRYTITPDSMQHLTMRMFDIMLLPVGGGHDFPFFKKNFVPMLQGAMADGKIEKTSEITFRGRKCMYAETVSGSLPGKVYGVDGGAYIYVIIVIPRRYVSVADPGIERDGNAILNSIVIAP